MAARGPQEAVDVAVVGGGPAGIAAALAAAREGARTLLFEREPRLGGNAANAFVHTVCGLYEGLEQGEDGTPVFTNPGLPRHVARALTHAGDAGPPERAGKVFYLPIDPAGFSRLAARECERAPGLVVRLGVAIDEVESRDDGFVVRSEAGATRASILLDTSGDATTAARVGCGTRRAERPQRPSYVFRLSGVDTAALAGFERVRTSVSVQTGVREGALPARCESVTVRAGVASGDAFVTLTLPSQTDEGDLANPAVVAAHCAEGRELAERVFAFLQRERAPFRGARVSAWPHRVGVRETARAEGRIVLGAEDVLEGRSHPEEVARSSWPIELWEDHRRARFQHPKGSCSIPLGCLVSERRPRLGFAGRCLSASHEALGAVRVIGTALATGEAVGVAAALAADAGHALGDAPAAEVRRRITASAAP
ncbi:MAG: FAD-dependent oxidoreductase [Myxococcota bacterium]|nr:FAD-dependent oxidoreductase [Myxococcota bacterium]